ncbi:hypothetical protein JB92DRAFT_2904750 [Gautieria morchelliformis]|nr:hypothetical protein JB92DRAFT_2904750 [Gautieria morchelliformis]
MIEILALAVLDTTNYKSALVMKMLHWVTDMERAWRVNGHPRRVALLVVSSVKHNVFLC